VLLVRVEQQAVRAGQAGIIPRQNPQAQLAQEQAAAAAAVVAAAAVQVEPFTCFARRTRVVLSRQQAVRVVRVGPVGQAEQAGLVAHHQRLLQAPEGQVVPQELLVVTHPQFPSPILRSRVAAVVAAVVLRALRVALAQVGA
jgi:hypothetical protein